MQLKTIKLSGFKSFADPVVIPIVSQLTGIVGPNGCGKSNVVDGIRCVLSGAAKQLRGGTMPDIIFNGSAKRKPVGQASVELIFDNEDGSVGGEYANYPEISIRREVNRDATSDYFLNGIHCRRRDVIDLFLGTGLGPNSYAIIEQGMISRFIEAKPEDLRVYLEEAAGISKYKERRRETENRIENTRENLERLADHRLELEKQLEHLQRQAKAAERYKELKQEERGVKAELQAIHWSELKTQLAEQTAQLQIEENRIEVQTSELRQLELAIEKLRQQRVTDNEAFNAVQTRFYSMGAEIARLEQQLNYARERQQQLQNDLTQLNNTHRDLIEQQQQDEMQAEELTAELTQLEPKLDASKATAEQAATDLKQAEITMHDWQQTWDEFNQQAGQVARTVEVERTRIQHLEQLIDQAQQRVGRLEIERSQVAFSAVDEEIQKIQIQHAALQQRVAQAQQAQNHNSEQLTLQRGVYDNFIKELDQARHQLQTLRGRQASLEALQQAALGKNDQLVTGWLQQQQLMQQPRLAESLKVLPGWELAVETVLGPYLEAVCVNDINQFANALMQIGDANLTLWQTSTNNPNAIANQRVTLASKVQATGSLEEILDTVYVADDLGKAFDMRAALAPHESVVTQDGVWLGRHWLRIAKNKDAKAGILQRERELHELQQTIQQQQTLLSEKEAAFELAKRQLTEFETERQQLQQQLQLLSNEASQVQSQLSAQQARAEQLHKREQVMQLELTETQQQLQQTQQQLAATLATWQSANDQMAQDDVQKTQLLNQRESCRQQLEVAREQAQTTKTAADELQMQLETTRSQLHFVRQSMQRAEKQLQDIQTRRVNLEQSLTEIEAPIPELQQTLEQALQNRLSVEKELTAARQQVDHTEHQLRDNEQRHTELVALIQEQRGQLEQLRMQLQALQIEQRHHEEKIIELGFVLETVLAQLPEIFSITEWQEKVSRVENRIQRLGAINLAAIDEYQQLAERKNYLDAQNNDLMEALATLEDAIKKIDHESRARLRETHEKVNVEFNKIFQGIFNGGHAELELTGDDVLSTGMIVRAQPPGKRNTTIHLLSGGEKALTAIALVFAMFQLNPAPFCILDEVDAPLDDINVGRFCNLVKSMSSKIQFLFISHNKLTIEIAEQLVGVTMNEPGVSRLVSVDIEQAIKIAA
jgi:chromosome segregation protein